ncbi:MAG: EAL domain-containing protein [Actinomycetota bacterium]
MVRPLAGLPALLAAIAGALVALGGLLFVVADDATVELASEVLTGGTALLLLFSLVVAAQTSSGRWRAGWLLLAVPTIIWQLSYVIDPIDPEAAVTSVPLGFWLSPIRTVTAIAAIVLFAWPIVRKASPLALFLDSLWLGLAALLVTWGLVGEPASANEAFSGVELAALTSGSVLAALLFGFVAVLVPMADSSSRRTLALLLVAPVALAVGDDAFAHGYVSGDLQYGSASDFVLLATFGVAAIAVLLRPAHPELRSRIELPAARSVVITMAPLTAFSALVFLAEFVSVGFEYRLGAAVTVVGVIRLTYLAARVRTLAGDLHRRATHDPLTDLPNRAALDDAMEELVMSDAGLLMIDLDRFKAVNDTLGHAAGDQLLILVSRRIATACGAGWNVFRLAGDEFVALSTSTVELDQVVATGRRVVERLSLPFHLDGREAWIGASVGAAATEDAATEDAVQAGHLLDIADLALRTAKDGAKGEVVTADADVRRRAQDRGHLEHALRHAVDRNELFSLYQPKVDLTTGAMVGMEALVRWNRPGHGVVPPGEFIAVAEASGLIARVDSWVLADGVANLRRWNEIRGNRTRLKLSTNMSAWQLARVDVDDEVTRTIAWEGGVDPAQLTIELTETLLIEDPEVVARRLRRLTDTGVGISVDDFGAGFTSVAYLRKFPISEVKIDRALVWELTGGPEDDESLAAAVIALARAMNLDVVAEGVETVEQAAALRRLGCRIAQGFLFAKPLPIEEIDELVDQSHPFADLIGDSVPATT